MEFWLESKYKNADVQITESLPRQTWAIIKI